MEWVEVRGKTIDIAVEAAMRELGVDDRERLSIEVIQEPERGFLGLGGRDAIVRVRPAPAKKRRRRRRKGAGGEGERPADRRGGGRQQGGQRGAGQGGARGGGQQGRRGGGRTESPQRREAADRSDRSRDTDRGDRRGRDRRQEQPRSEAGRGSQETPRQEGSEVSIEEQVPVVEGFLTGLVEAFGLEGDVSVHTEDDTIVAQVQGGQTEAMVGPRGSVIEAIHELTKTVLQRKTQASARVRLDIAGYGERRRQALSIYAAQLIDQVLEEGGEVMLEPMSAGDRKVIHDAVAAREGVRSYSEGEAPERYVVIAREAGPDDEEE